MSIRRLLPVAFFALSSWATSAQDGFTPPGGGPSESEVQGWVHSSYPALLEASMPEGLVLGFLVTPEFKLLRHSAAVGRTSGPTNQDLARMFPAVSLEHPPMSGANCYPASNGKRGYCVYWAVAPAAT